MYKDGWNPCRTVNGSSSFRPYAVGRSSRSDKGGSADQGSENEDGAVVSNRARDDSQSGMSIVDNGSGELLDRYARYYQQCRKLSVVDRRLPAVIAGSITYGSIRVYRNLVVILDRYTPRQQSATSIHAEAPGTCHSHTHIHIRDQGLPPGTAVMLNLDIPRIAARSLRSHLLISVFLAFLGKPGNCYKSLATRRH